MVMIDEVSCKRLWAPKDGDPLEYRGVMERIDIVTGTFGKALGGASADAARKEIVELLRQRNRPICFNTGEHCRSLDQVLEDPGGIYSLAGQA